MNIHVLVVDDDRGIILAMTEWLSKRGCSVTTASEVRGDSGMAGLLARTQFQLGFFDLNVGADLSVTVIESTLLRLPKPFPFVMMTADENFQPTPSMVASGLCVKVLLKPLSIQMVQGAFAEAVSRIPA